MSGLAKLILRLAPRSFRERHATEMARVQAERRNGLRTAGWARRLLFEAREAFGLLVLVLRLRLAGENPGAPSGSGALEALWQDARYAVRTLRRSPVYAASAVGILAVGIGANAAIFGAANAFLFRPLPFADEDRLVVMYETNPEYGWTHDDPTTAAPANALDWRERVDAFQDVAMYASFVDDVTWLRDGEPVLLGYVQVSGNLFDVLGAAPLLGRTMRWEETWAGGGDVAMLSHAAWIREFGGDPDVVGRTIDLAGTQVEIVGVMPSGFGFPSPDVDLWRPWGWEPGYRSETWFRRAHFVWPVARLAAGVSREEADAQLQAVVASLQDEYPGTNRVMGAAFLPIRRFLVGDTDGQLRLLLGAGALLLLLACVNVANLALVRGAERRQEVALRHALGADRARVTSLVAAESGVVALAGGALGLALGWLGVRTLGRSAHLGIEGVTSATLDHRVVLFTLAATLASALLFGLAPALRVASGDVREELAEGGRGGVGPGRRRAAQALVAAEVALAVLLVAGAGLMARTAWELRNVDPGFDGEGVLAFQVTAPSSRYPERADVLSFWDRLIQGLEARPGVESAGTVARVPLDGVNYTSQLTAEGWGPERSALEVVHRRADAGFFETVRTPLVEGRLFTPGDDPDGPPVVLVNETFARTYFPAGDAVGQRVTYERVASDESTWREIVGVVADQHQESPAVPPRPEVFENRDQDWSRTLWVVVRRDGVAMDALPAVRAVLREIDPLVPLGAVRPLERVWRTSMAREETLLALLGAFAALALLLAGVGVFAVTAQAARARTREIGVRVALGARRPDVVRLVVVQGLGAVVVGVAVGLTASVMGGGVLRSVLFGVEPGDPVTLAGVAALLLAVASVACWLPARRATRVDPAATLKD